MTEFLAELYVPRTAAAAIEQVVEPTRHAAAELTAEGAPVRLLQSILVPEDETCLLLFEAESIDAVRETARRAALSFEHIGEVASDVRWIAGDEHATTEPPPSMAPVSGHVH
jgi:hypothetical protein